MYVCTHGTICLLLHGTDVMRHFLLSIGQYSEEVADTRNKDLRNINSLKHARSLVLLQTRI